MPKSDYKIHFSGMLALFFVSAMEFILERAGTDLLLMTGAPAILLWGGSQNTLKRGARAVCVVIALPQSSSEMMLQETRQPKQRLPQLYPLIGDCHEEEDIGLRDERIVACNQQ